MLGELGAYPVRLGIGLVVIGVAMWRRSPGALAALAIVAGIATVPVCLQIWSDLAARWLAVAGPLWLLTILVSSVWLWRDRS